MVKVCVFMCTEEVKKWKKTSLKAEEALASVVEMYPCMYNKADPQYKEKDRR